jgi:hypothetical protein
LFDELCGLSAYSYSHVDGFVAVSFAVLFVLMVGDCGIGIGLTLFYTLM